MGRINMTLAAATHFHYGHCSRAWYGLGFDAPLRSPPTSRSIMSSTTIKRHAACCSLLQSVAHTNDGLHVYPYKYPAWWYVKIQDIGHSVNSTQYEFVISDSDPT